MMVIGGGTFGIKLDHNSEVFMSGISGFIRRQIETFLICLHSVLKVQKDNIE